MRFLVLLVGMVALSMFAGPVLALPAVAGDADACVKGTGDEKIAATPRHLGARIGFMSVLHTWGSALTQNPHSRYRALSSP